MIRSLQNSEGRPPPERRATRRFPIVAQSDTELFAGACSYERESGARSILAAGESFFRLTLLWNPICTWNSRLTGRCSNKCVGICDVMRSAKSFG